MDLPPELSVSIFLPTHSEGNQIQQDPVRLKNLLRKARGALTERGVGWREIDHLLAPGEALVATERFWRYQSAGLALLLRGGSARTYRLPRAFEELAAVGDRFHLSPLIPLLAENARFFLLALSQHRVRLLDASRDAAAEADLEGVPRSRDEALAYDDPESQLQSRVGPSPIPTSVNPGPRSTRPGTVFHGHAPKDEERNALTRFCQSVAGGLRPILREQTAPLVLAGVAELLSIYRSVQDYPHVVDRAVEGNPDLVGDDELRARAWEFVWPRISQREELARARFAALSGTGQTAKGVSEVGTAAREGRVATLFVSARAHQWGRADEGTGEPLVRSEPRPGDEDLLDRAAVDALRAGAEVYTVAPERVPARSEIAAVLRY